MFQHFYKAVFKNASTSSEPEVQPQEGRQELWGSRVTDWKHSELKEILKCLQETWDQSSYLKSDSLVSVFEFLNLIMNESHVYGSPEGQVRKSFLNLIKINIFPPVLNVPTWLDTRCPLWSKWILQKQTQFFFFNLFPQIVKFFLKILPIILFYFGEFFFFFNLKMCKIK